MQSIVWNEWLTEQMNSWVDGWMNIQMDKLVEWMDEYTMNGLTYKLMDKHRSNKWMNGQWNMDDWINTSSINGWMDKRILDEWTNTSSINGRMHNELWTNRLTCRYMDKHMRKYIKIHRWLIMVFDKLNLIIWWVIN